MALTHEDVKKIATLARLRFSPQEEDRLTRELASILDYIDQLQDFSGAEPATAPQGAREAEDRPEAGLPRELLLANAPAALEAFVLVPEVKGGGGDA